VSNKNLVDKSKFVDKIPLFYIPNELYINENAIRALKHKKAVINDYLPSFLVNPDRKHNCKNLQLFYTVSFYDNIQDLENDFKNLPKHFRDKFIAYGIGNTVEEFGVATAPNASGHIGYFLYDAYNNNPYNDFKVKVK